MRRSIPLLLVHLRLLPRLTALLSVSQAMQPVDQQYLHLHREPPEVQWRDLRLLRAKYMQPFRRRSMWIHMSFAGKVSGLLRLQMPGPLIGRALRRRGILASSLAAMACTCALATAMAVAADGDARDAARSYWCAVIKGDGDAARSMLTAEMRRLVPVEAMRAYASWARGALSNAGRPDIEKITSLQVRKKRAAFTVALAGVHRRKQVGAYLVLEDKQWRIASPSGMEPLNWAPRTKEQREVAAVAERYLRAFARGDGAAAYRLVSQRSQSAVGGNDWVSRVNRVSPGMMHLVMLGPPTIQEGGTARVESLEWQRLPDGKVIMFDEPPLWLVNEAGKGWRLQFGSDQAEPKPR